MNGKRIHGEKRALYFTITQIKSHMPLEHHLDTALRSFCRTKTSLGPFISRYSTQSSVKRFIGDARLIADRY